MRNSCFTALALVSLGGMLGPHEARGQTLTTMFRFDGADGAAIIWKPVADGQGNLYGTTMNGGPNVSQSNPYGLGTIYRFTPSTRAFETLHNFAGGADGATPLAGLTYDQNTGMLYGTTFNGGLTNSICSQGCGTIFSLNAATGAYTTLYTFSGGADEEYPSAALTLGSDGVLYGITRGLGIGKDCIQQTGCGTVFEYDPGNRAFTTIHAFSFLDGEVPSGPLVFGKAGKLFGVTSAGGNVERNDAPAGLGVVFRMDPDGSAFTVVHRFSSFTIPLGIAADADRNLYVTAEEGGINGTGAIIKLAANVGAPYTISTLFSFDANENNVSGELPEAPLAFDAKKLVFYGTTYDGGADGYGTMFQIDPSGAFSVLHSFTGGTDGGNLDDSILISLGDLYGGTRGHRPTKLPQQCVGYDCGTLFKLPRF